MTDQRNYINHAQHPSNQLSHQGEVQHLNKIDLREPEYSHQQPSNLDLAQDYVNTQTKATPKFEHRAQNLNRLGSQPQYGSKQPSYSAYPGQLEKREAMAEPPKYCPNCQNCRRESNQEQPRSLKAKNRSNLIPSHEDIGNRENSYSEDNLLQSQGHTQQYPTLSCENQTGEQTQEQIAKVDRDLSMLSFNDSIGGMTQFQNQNCQAPGTQPHATLFNSREATVMANNTGLFSCHHENRVLLSLFKDGKPAARAVEACDQVKCPSRPGQFEQMKESGNDSSQPVVDLEGQAVSLRQHDEKSDAIESRISRLSHFTSTLTRELMKVNKMHFNSSDGEKS